MVEVRCKEPEMKMAMDLLQSTVAYFQPHSVLLSFWIVQTEYYKNRIFTNIIYRYSHTDLMY